MARKATLKANTRRILLATLWLIIPTRPKHCIVTRPGEVLQEVCFRMSSRHRHVYICPCLKIAHQTNALRDSVARDSSCTGDMARFLPNKDQPPSKASRATERTGVSVLTAGGRKASMHAVYVLRRKPYNIIKGTAMRACKEHRAKHNHMHIHGVPKWKTTREV